MAIINLSFEEKWDKIMECDQTYDGLFFTAVKTTKIYCRPSCRARKPKKCNVEFFDDMKKVEQAGFRACKR
jgi:AraC family transcriptional regulator of adaptative response / methylphosphotriester-DNA alkyltransferase methyltransferase